MPRNVQLGKLCAVNFTMANFNFDRHFKKKLPNSFKFEKIAHKFVCAPNILKLNEVKMFVIDKFLKSFKSTSNLLIAFPTSLLNLNLFRNDEKKNKINSTS